MVRYRLPSVGSVMQLDRRCSHCSCPNGRIHSGVYLRHISDPRAETVCQRRMRCPRCGMTWTVRCEGVGAGRQRSDRLIGLGVVGHMLGLSYRSSCQLMACLDCHSSKSSIERDVAVAGRTARRLHEAAPRMKVRILGVDGTGAAMAGRNAGTLFFVDIGRGKLLCVEPLQETDTAKVRRHVRKVMAAVGAEELRTDEHSVYVDVAPEGRHRICLSHWRKSKCKRAGDLHRQAVTEGRQLEAQTMVELLELLRQEPRAPTVPDHLSRLVGRYIRARKGLPWKVNQLLQHVERTWEKVSDDPADPTNNVTERIIGLTYKIGAKTMRGFKVEAKALQHAYLSSFLRGDGETCDLRKVI